METRKIKNILAFLLDAIFPPMCVSCGARTEKQRILCGNCEKRIEINTSFSCPNCGGRLTKMKNECHPKAGYVLGSACSYKNNVIRGLIHALKYNRVTKAAEILAEILSSYTKHLTERYPEFKVNDFIVLPMPLHGKKERKRGFNQSFLVLKSFNELSDGCGSYLDVNCNLVKRKKNTPSQTKCKSKKERIAHMSGAFVVEDDEKIRGRNIIIFDDVFTSGATMNELVRAVKNAGAKKVIALVMAKT